MRLALCVMLFAACGAERPPFHALPLRDTLQAEARVLAQASPQERAILRQRFVTALGAADADGDAGPYVDDEIRAWSRFDARREAAGKDTVPAIVVDRGIDGARVRAAPVVVPSEPANVAQTLEGEAHDDAATALLMDAALSGAAGALVARWREDRRLVRVDHAPFAFARDETAVYVNPAWLVVMAEPRVPSTGPTVTLPARQSAITIGGVTNLDQCRQSVAEQCVPCVMDVNNCDPNFFLSDYTSGHAECIAVLSPGTNTARNICSSLALRRPEVRACVRRNDPGCLSYGDPTYNSFWDGFHAQPLCAKVFSRCVTDSRYVTPISCDVCTQSCDNSCGNACRGPSFNCSPSCETSTNSSGCPQVSGRLCATTPESASLPFLPIAFALLPLLYFARAARRK